MWQTQAMKGLKLTQVAVAAALLVAACSSGTGTASEAPTEEDTASEYEGLVDALAEEQASAREAFEATLTVTGGLVLTPDVSLVTDGKCLPLIPDQATHDRVFPLTDEPQVKILDASGAIVGTATLEATVSAAGDACAFLFETTVPSGGGFYTATVESFTSDAVAESEAVGGELTIDLASDL